MCSHSWGALHQRKRKKRKLETVMFGSLVGVFLPALWVWFRILKRAKQPPHYQTLPWAFRPLRYPGMVTHWDLRHPIVRQVTPSQLFDHRTSPVMTRLQPRLTFSVSGPAFLHWGFCYWWPIRSQLGVRWLIYLGCLYYTLILNII